VSRKLLGFLLSEIKAVRVICKSCHCGFEVNTVGLVRVQHRACSFCKEPLVDLPVDAPNPFLQLAQLVELLQKPDTAKCDIEFVVPEDSDLPERESFAHKTR
jgi:hypothetical protein